MRVLVVQLLYHIRSLRRGFNAVHSPAAIKAKCGPVLKKLMDLPYGAWFSEPVDPVKLQIPDYPTIVKRPMDLGTIKRRLDTAQYYRTFHDFQVDVDRVWYNARLYNPVRGTAVVCTLAPRRRQATRPAPDVSRVRRRSLTAYSKTTRCTRRLWTTRSGSGTCSARWRRSSSRR